MIFNKNVFFGIVFAALAIAPWGNVTIASEALAEVQAIKDELLSHKSDFHSIDEIILSNENYFVNAPQGQGEVLSFKFDDETLQAWYGEEHIQVYTNNSVKNTNLPSSYWMLKSGVIKSNDGKKSKIIILLNPRALKAGRIPGQKEVYITWLAHIVSKDFFFLGQDAYAYKCGNGSFVPIYLAEDTIVKGKYDALSEIQYLAKKGLLVGFVKIEAIE